MRILVMTVILAVCGIALAESAQSPDIQGDLLRRWPRNFKGAVVIPSVVRHIGSDAFSGCKELTEVELPETIETIGSFAFSGCDRLRDVRIPTSVTNIGRSVFFGCKTLTNATIRAKIREVPGNMFSHCCGLRHVELPDGLVEIGDMAFRGCRSLHKVGIPSSMRRIGKGAFIGCSRLSCIDMPKGIELIDEFAFRGCYDLKRLVLHSVPDRIGVDAFRDCYSLRGYVLSDVSLGNVLYFPPALQEITAENICKGEWMSGRYETVDDAFLVNGRLGEATLDNGLFDGLEQALRIAADGMVDAMPDKYYPVGKIDSLAANLFKLKEQSKASEIKEFFSRFLSTGGDAGNELYVNLCIEGDIAFTLRFKEDKIDELLLSDGLKDVIRGRLKKEHIQPDDNVLRWLK